VESRRPRSSSSNSSSSKGRGKESVCVNSTSQTGGADGSCLLGTLSDWLGADGSTAAVCSGTGLGLYICQRIMEMHGQKIWLKDTREGTAFAFSLTAAGKSSDLARRS